MPFTVYFLNINLKYNIENTSKIALKERLESFNTLFLEHSFLGEK